MTEIDRESELEDRREKLQKFEDRRQLKQMVAAQDVGADSDSDSKPSAMARRKGAAGERGKKLDELKRKRLDKTAREEKRARRAKGEANDSDDDGDDSKAKADAWDYSDDDDEDAAPGGSGRAGKSGKGKGVAAEDEDEGPEISSVEHIAPIVLQRGKLAEYWPRDFFPQYIKDAYVRIGVGMFNGAMEYRLAQIVGISEKKASAPYDLEKHRTDLKLTLAHGEQKQDFKMDMISNSPLTEVCISPRMPGFRLTDALSLLQKELNRYLVTLRVAKLPIPTTKAVMAKRRSMKDLQNSRLTEVRLKSRRIMVLSLIASLSRPNSARCWRRSEKPQDQMEAATCISSIP
jgi:hypothetical protein